MPIDGQFIDVVLKGDDDLLAVIQAMRNRCGDLRPFWGSIATVFSDREEYLFSSGGAGAWPALSDKYAAWKAKHFPGMPILNREQSLKESLTPKFGKGNAFTVYEERPASLTIGTSHPYAVYHHEGIGGKKTKRPPIIMDEQTQIRMLEVLDEDFRVYAESLGWITTRS
jgi:phage gpG-like protein